VLRTAFALLACLVFAAAVVVPVLVVQHVSMGSGRAVGNDINDVVSYLSPVYEPARESQRIADRGTNHCVFRV
jgi:hypothetical protein